VISRVRSTAWNRPTGPLSSPRVAHRVGICSSCRSRYQIPATFAHDRARCRSCGGVVEFGPLEGEAPAPRPTAATAATAAPATSPTSAPMPAPAPAVAPAPALSPRVATATETARPLAAATSAEPSAPPRRSPLVAVLVGGLVLAALAFAAWRLLG